MKRTYLINIAKQIIVELKLQDIIVDCWSVKNDGAATINYDIAIDIKTPIHLPILIREFKTTTVEYDSSLTRLNFNVNLPK